VSSERRRPEQGTAELPALETPQARIPSATYRLQFNHEFTFNDARAIVPYLAELGISDIYASPILKSREGSPHGYDICDHSQVDPAIGSEDDLAALADELRRHGMGLILDTVPNHMGIGSDCNAWWMDVLENGPSSVYASYFDIDWHPGTTEMENKVLLPMLEDQYGKVLESGKLRLTYADGGFTVRYYEDALPVAPRTYGPVLSYGLERLVASLGEEDEHLQDLQSILTALHYLPPTTETDPDRVAEGKRESEVIRRRVAALYDACPQVRSEIERAVEEFNGRPDDPRSYDMLDRLLDAQAYRPAFWRVASEEINYRRFFDINDLAAIRVELPEVFEATHALLFRLLGEGKANGLRVDHPDGLYNPGLYFERLQQRYLTEVSGDGASTEADTPSAAPRARTGAGGSNGASAEQPPLYVVAEKILTEGEALDPDWAIHGTTGYDFLNSANALFVDSRNARSFDRIYSQFIGRSMDFHELENTTKKMIMLVSFASEISSLGLKLDRITQDNRWYRDFTRNSLIFALREIVACLPVYRTYITPDGGKPGRRDRRRIETAVDEAKRRNPRTAESLFDFIRDTLLLRNVHTFPKEDRARLHEFVMKFQQVTGPAMAKGVEDTAFYVFNRLVSLNEVGGNPARFGRPPADFHAANAERQRSWPHSMLASSTHDTKRGEDVRARINVLSEIPAEWRAAVARWARMNAPKKKRVDGAAAPDRNDEYLLYQTLLGSWPVDMPSDADFAGYRERVLGYMLKATKEAKVHTSWVNANEQYDAAVQNFVRAVLPDDRASDPFLADLLELQRRVDFFGRYNGLSQLLLKLASPGVPDSYQGTELWMLTLVDPDNRRPVDYAQRRHVLEAMRERVGEPEADLRAYARELLDASGDGRVKLYVTQRALAFRREHHDLFAEGAYVPLHARGECADHVCAFARTLGDRIAVVVVPRLVVGLGDGQERRPLGDVWGDTELVLPPAVAKPCRDLFTGAAIEPRRAGDDAVLPMASVLGDFPVALLTNAR
jgi:(1->4)-alpha-D-glucan 1-alpha-D-glucosylmutase